MSSPMILELWPTSGIEEADAVIRGVYRHVLGNAHVMDSERLVIAESKLRKREISVREFVRTVAKSDFYRERFFESSAPYRFVELNFLHLLGRAPQDQREVSEHIVTAVAEGFDAEIDSYLDSDEYQAAFGENIVPYYRGRSTENNAKNNGYNRMFALDRGNAQVDSCVKSSQLVYDIATNRGTKIKASTPTVIGSGTEKRFKIVVSGSKFDSPRRVSATEYIVSASKMTPQIQRINRTSGKIVSITEIV